MKRIVIIGNSIASIKVIEEIRKGDQASEIMLFSFKEPLPYYGNLLADLVAKRVPVSDVYYRKQDFYKQQKVIKCEENISKINFKRSKIITETKKHINYDWLVISDMALNSVPEQIFSAAEQGEAVLGKAMKGVNKSGVFYPRRLLDATQLMQYLPTADTAIIQTEGIQGVKIAGALLRRNKEVLMVYPKEQILSSLIDKESSQVIQKFLEQEGVQLIPENAISEILGESDVKAVKLKSGKVLACQLVIFDNEKADLKLFKNTELEIQDRICVNSRFQTNIENVFAFDGVCDFGKGQQQYDTYPAVLEQEGAVTAAYIINKDSPEDGRGCPNITILNENERANGRTRPQEKNARSRSRTTSRTFLSENAVSPLRSRSQLNSNVGIASRAILPIKISQILVGDVSIDLLGETKDRNEICQNSIYNEESGIYKKIFIRDGCIIGAILINCSAEKEKMLQLIKNQADIAGKEDELLGKICETASVSAQNEMPALQGSLELIFPPTNILPEKEKSV